MADDKQSTSIPLTDHSGLIKNGHSGSDSSLQDPEDAEKTRPSSPNSSTRKVCGLLDDLLMCECVPFRPINVEFLVRCIFRAAMCFRASSCWVILSPQLL